jgi:hypothetical protein
MLDDDGRAALDRLTVAFGMSKSQIAETAGLAREVLYKEARLRAPKTRRACARCWKS